MTTIVVQTPNTPITVLFSGNDTTVITGPNTPVNVVVGQNLQTVIFNGEGPPGPSGDTFDPGDLVAIYNQAKED